MKQRDGFLLLVFLFIINLLFISCFASAGTLKVTEEHPFLVDGKWIQANELKLGDKIQTLDGKNVTITSLENIETQEDFQVYNLEVENYSNFIIGNEELIVHNSEFKGGNLKDGLSYKQKKILKERPVSPEIQTALASTPKSDFVDVVHVTRVNRLTFVQGETPIEQTGIILPSDYSSMQKGPLQFLAYKESSSAEGVYVMPLVGGQPATRSQWGLRLLTGIKKNPDDMFIAYKLRIPKSLIKLSKKGRINSMANDFYVDFTKDTGLNFRDMGIKFEYLGKLDNTPIIRWSEFNIHSKIIFITDFGIIALAGIQGIINIIVPKNSTLTP
jgi:hypothetical protein